MSTENDEMKLVTVAVTEQSHQAEMLKNLLSNEGIESFIQDEIIGSFIPFAVGIRLQVAETDAEKAKQVLSDAGYNE